MSLDQSSTTCVSLNSNHRPDMKGAVFQAMTVALMSSLTWVSCTTLPFSQVYPSCLAFYCQREYYPDHAPLLLPAAATGPQSSVSDGVERSKGLGLLDLILLKQLTSRVNQLEEMLKSLTISNNELEGTVSQLEGTVNNLTISNNELEGTVNNLTISNNQLEETVKNLTSSNGQGGSGQPTSIGGMPTSCDDLRTLGNVMSGFYNIKSSTKVATVFCDFTKQSTDAGFQQVIGNADVKSTAVYFYVHLRDDQPASTLGKIPFEDEILNVGNSMNATSGTFTAPVDGTYFFSFAGTIGYTDSNQLLIAFIVFLRVNNQNVAYGETDESGMFKNQYNPVHLEATLNLKKGDTVDLVCYGDQIVDLLGRHFTSFSGILLSEENFPS